MCFSKQRLAITTRFSSLFLAKTTPKTNKNQTATTSFPATPKPSLLRRIYNIGEAIISDQQQTIKSHLLPYSKPDPPPVFLPLFFPANNHQKLPVPSPFPLFLSFAGISTSSDSHPDEQTTATSNSGESPSSFYGKNLVSSSDNKSARPSWLHLRQHNNKQTQNFGEAIDPNNSNIFSRSNQKQTLQ